MIHVRHQQLHLLRLDLAVVFIPQQVVGTEGDGTGRDVRPGRIIGRGGEDSGEEKCTEEY